MDKIALPVLEVVKAKKNSAWGGGERTRALLDLGSNRYFSTERLQKLVGEESRPVIITQDNLCAEERSFLRRWT